METQLTNNRYVQYGCGFSAPTSWRNFDASPTLRFERLPLIGKLYTKNAMRFPENVQFGDIVTGLPVDDGSCKAIYCSHVLEHLSLEDFRVALANTHRMLEKGGLFRLVVPDLTHAVSKYCADLSPEASLLFMRETGLGLEKRSRNLRGFIFQWLQNGQHLWMWDFKAMVPELEKAGFVDIRRATLGDSSDLMFKDVEHESRWTDCLGIECGKRS